MGISVHIAIIRQWYEALIGCQSLKPFEAEATYPFLLSSVTRSSNTHTLMQPPQNCLDGGDWVVRCTIYVLACVTFCKIACIAFKAHANDRNGRVSVCKYVTPGLLYQGRRSLKCPMQSGALSAVYRGLARYLKKRCHPTLVHYIFGHVFHLAPYW